MNIIEIKGVTKDYALGKTIVRALRGIDLVIEEGDLMTIMGPSGSGKTTLLNIVGCIDQATEGSVRVHGDEVTKLNDRQVTDLRLHRIGFIFQTFNLIPVLNALENVEFPLLLLKRTPARRSGARPKRSSKRWASATTCTTSRPNFRVASGSAWPSPARS